MGHQTARLRAVMGEGRRPLPMGAQESQDLPCGPTLGSQAEHLSRYSQREKPRSWHRQRARLASQICRVQLMHAVVGARPALPCSQMEKAPSQTNPTTTEQRAELGRKIVPAQELRQSPLVLDAHRPQGRIE